MRYIYYPSCNFQRMFPEVSGRLLAYLGTQPDVQAAGCCRRTDDLPRPGDTIVTVCMSCMRMLEEVRPDIPQISLYEFLLTREDFPWAANDDSFILQDCFRARGRHALHEAVRKCLRRTGARIVEMPRNRDEESYDGTFLLHEPFAPNVARAPRYFGEYLPGHLTPLPREEWPRFLAERARMYATLGEGLPVVGYCNTCVEGTGARHVMEVLMRGQ